jgi:hypothetical protein
MLWGLKSWSERRPTILILFFSSKKAFADSRIIDQIHPTRRPSLSLYLNQHLRLRVCYILSPSIRTAPFVHFSELPIDPKNAKYIVTQDKRLLEIQRGRGQFSWFMNNKVAEGANIGLLL